MCQISHLGRRADATTLNWLPAVAPSRSRETQHRICSAVPCPRYRPPERSPTVTLTALLVLGSVALIAVVPGLVDSGFLGGLVMPTALRLVLHLPLALALLSLTTAAVVAWGWLRHWCPPSVRLQYATLAAAAITLASQMAAWQLIGWGFT